MIGFFGGTFDPIHSGHLNLAERLKSQAGLAEVWFCPAFLNPFKQKGSSPEDRLEMIRLALQDRPGLKVIDDEIKKGGLSYTIDTIRALMEKTGKSFRLILGEDLVADFAKWKEASALIRLAPPLIGERDAISATHIRNLFVTGREREAEELVPPAVFDYILKKGLYGQTPT